MVHNILLVFSSQIVHFNCQAITIICVEDCSKSKIRFRTKPKSHNVLYWNPNILFENICLKLS